MIRQTIVVSLIVGGALWGQSAESVSAPAAPAASPNPQSPAAPGNRLARTYVSRHALAYYELVWGVSELNVRYAESGEMIRFSYRVVDPARAQMLNDKKLEPSLIDPSAGVSLVVPSLEKVGQLRQAPRGELEAGKSYWMAFSNVGRRVKKGDRVNVVVGNFHVDGLIVE